MSNFRHLMHSLLIANCWIDSPSTGVTLSLAFLLRNRAIMSIKFNQMLASSPRPRARVTAASAYD